MKTEFGIDLSLLTDYLWDECSPAQRAQVEEWIAQHAGHQLLVTQVRDALASVVVAGHATIDLDGVTQNVLREVLPSGSSNPFGGHVRLPRWGAGAVLGAVLGTVLCAGLAVGAFWARSTGWIGWDRLRRDRSASITPQVYATRVGQWSTVRLTDGSSIVLGPATTVAVRPTRVEVTGEAVFTVVPRAARPMVVQTRNATVRVLGTQFRVRQYRDEANSRVIVTDGKVAVHRLGSRLRMTAASPRSEPSLHETHGTMALPTILVAGMHAQVTDSTVTVSSSGVLEDATAWMQGTLVFRDVPMRDVVAELARVYGTEIRVTDTTLAATSMIITVSVRDRTLPSVLDLIGMATDAHYTHVGQTYFLIPGRTAAHTPVQTPFRRSSPQLEKQYGR